MFWGPFSTCSSQDSTFGQLLLRCSGLARGQGAWGIEQVVPLPIVAGGLQLHQHHETDQGLPGDALQGDAEEGLNPVVLLLQMGDAFIFVRIERVHLS